MTESQQKTNGPLLKVDGLHAYYGLAHILADVALEVRRDEVVALLGRNGAGKSTTMKSVMGLVPPAKGSVQFNGQEVAGLEPHLIAQAGLGYVPEDRRVFSELTVLENLTVGRQPPREGAPEWTIERVFDLFPKMAELRDRPSGRMSGGEQQMLTIIRTLMGNPSLVLLDEPSEGLAPIIVEQMANAILKLKTEGLSILLSEQNLHFSDLVSDRAYIIEKGGIRYEGAMSDLAKDEEVRAAYLTV